MILSLSDKIKENYQMGKSTVKYIKYTLKYNNLYFLFCKFYSHQIIILVYLDNLSHGKVIINKC